MPSKKDRPPLFPFEGLSHLTPLYDCRLIAPLVTVAAQSSFCLQTWLDDKTYEQVCFNLTYQKVATIYSTLTFIISFLLHCEFTRQH